MNIFDLLLKHSSSYHIILPHHPGHANLEVILELYSDAAGVERGIVCAVGNPITVLYPTMSLHVIACHRQDYSIDDGDGTSW